MGDRHIHIEPAQLRALLAGRWSPAGDGVVWCGSVVVGTVAGERLTAVACANPHHGPHPRYASRLRSLISASDPANCPTCGGSLFLPLPGPDAQRQNVLALALGVFRGIVMPASEDPCPTS